MLNYRRTTEANPLRIFFREQLDILRTLALRWIERRKQRVRYRVEADATVELIVEGTDKRIRGVMNYRKRLRKSAGICLRHIESIVDDMSAPVDASEASFQHPSEAKMLLSSRERLSELFQQNLDVVSALRRQKADAEGCVYFLYLSGYTEKQVLRPELRGELVMSDVLRTIANFPGRRVELPAGDEANLRKSVKQYLFELLVMQLRADILQRKHAPSEDAAQSDLNNPENYLALLDEMLSSSEIMIHVDHQALRIDSMGYKVENEASEIPEHKIQRVSIGESNPSFIAMLSIPQSELDTLS